MSIINCIKNKISDQDFNQKLNSGINVLIELYKVLISTMLILFVPQKCEDHVCSYSENLNSDGSTYTGGIVINFITLLTFLVLYSVEIKRENRLITYLEVNNKRPSDNISVEQALNKLSNERKNSIISLDKLYQRIGKFSVVMFISNTILSGIIIYNYYLDNQTTTTYVTNILFMSTKISDVYVNSNTEENIFYSAYLKSKVQYNDVDPNKVSEISNNECDNLEMQNTDIGIENTL